MLYEFHPVALLDKCQPATAWTPLGRFHSRLKYMRSSQDSAALGSDAMEQIINRV